MKHNLPSPSEFLPGADEMCNQFNKTLRTAEDEYWGEKALLNILLARKDIDPSNLVLGQADIHRTFGGHTASDEHLIRRAKIYELLGQHDEAIQILSSLHSSMELV